MGKITRHGGTSDARTGEGMPAPKLRLPGERGAETVDPAQFGRLPGHGDGAIVGSEVFSEAKEISSPPDGYDDTDAWSRADLQAECKRRGLVATGDRAALIERLRDGDATP